MKKQVLPLTDPIVDAYPGYAASLSVLLNHKQGREWFVENYLNLYTLYDLENEFFYVDYLSFQDIFISSMHHCQTSNILSPLINVYGYPLDHVAAHFPDIVDLLRHEIDSGRYIYMYINRRLVSKFQFDLDYIHETFVYGYDDEEAVIFLKDYIQGKYIEFTCSYDEIRSGTSYSNIGNNINYGIFQQKVGSKLSTFEYRERQGHGFSANLLVRNIECYLSGHVYNDVRPVIFEVSKDSKKEELFGLNHYNAFIRYMRHCIEKNESIDKRLLHFLYTHKKCIAYKIQYLVEQGFVPSTLLESTNAMVNEALLIRNYALKHNWKNNSSGNLKILSNLSLLKDHEQALLEQLHAHLIRAS